MADDNTGLFARSKQPDDRHAMLISRGASGRYKLGMEWLWLGFGLFAGFAMLSVLGGERQRRIDALPPEPVDPATEPAADAHPHA